MHDLKTGQLIGATPRFQIIAQGFGVMTGALAGSAVYLLLIPDPQGLLINAEWPAPAVATWKAVAEVLADGLASVPTGALPAMGDRESVVEGKWVSVRVGRGGGPNITQKNEYR